MRNQMINSVKQQITKLRITELRNMGLSSNEVIDTVLKESSLKAGIPGGFSVEELNSLKKYILSLA